MTQTAFILLCNEYGIDHYHCAIWEAWPYATGTKHIQQGTTPLIAAMRCYVASKLGDDVEIPENLQ